VVGGLKRLLKSYSNGQKPAIHERGVECLLYEYEKLAAGLSEHTGQTGRLTPNMLMALSEGNYELANLG
jgi:hypothetical protein